MDEHTSYWRWSEIANSQRYKSLKDKSEKEFRKQRLWPVYLAVAIELIWLIIRPFFE